MEQFCILIKTGLRITANVITDEGDPDDFWKLCSTFNKLLVLKNTFFSVIDYCLDLGKM